MVNVRPTSIEALIATIQREYPNARLQITGRGRTIRRQAELMAEQMRANRQVFLHTYRATAHITEMDQWLRNNSQANQAQTVAAFEGIIRRAVSRGAVVSNHLSDTARDISWPVGTPQDLDAIEQRIRALGAHTLREPNAAGGRHWHVDW